MNATRALFILLGAVALAVVLQRPLCNAAHPQMHAAEPATCCYALGGTNAAKPLDLLVDASATPPVAPAPFAYLVAAIAFLFSATRFVRRAPAPPRSYYARSSRILR